MLRTPTAPSSNPHRPAVIMGLREEHSPAQLMQAIDVQCLGRPRFTPAAVSLHYPLQTAKPQIIQAFGSWLKTARPCPSPVRRGKKRNDERAALDGLGIMRLLQWHRMTDDAFPVRFRLRGRRACYKLRQLALEKFKQFFPFLPSEEKPSSWTTWPETEKMCLKIEREMEALDSSRRRR